MDIIEAILTFGMFAFFACTTVYAIYQLVRGIIIIFQILWFGFDIIFGIHRDD